MENQMNVSSFRPRLLGSSALLAAAIALGAAMPALADTSTVTQAVSAGILSASVANGTMSSVALSHINQPAGGTLTLTADDSTGSSAGWNVTVVGSAPFVYTAPVPNPGYTNADIPIANLSLVSAALPVVIAGQAVNATIATGPEITGVTVGTLGSARRVVQATAGYGSGSYSQVLNVSLDVPGNSRPGTYVGGLTTTISSAP
jgi:X-Pro dipeptidyl-peptidase